MGKESWHGVNGGSDTKKCNSRSWGYNTGAFYAQVRLVIIWFSDAPPPNLIENPKNELGGFINNLLAVVRRRKYGDPVRVDLPTLGLCNRRSCGELYKYLDEFRNSDFFINMQTFFSLMQDEDGMDLILDVLGDPKLLQQLAGGSGGIFGGKKSGGDSGDRPPPKISSSIDSIPDTLDFDLSSYDYSNYGPTDAEKESAFGTKTITVEETIRIPDSKASTKTANAGQVIPPRRIPTGPRTFGSRPPPLRPTASGRGSVVVIPHRGQTNIPSTTGRTLVFPHLRSRPPVRFPRPGQPLRPLPAPRTTTPGYRREDDPYYVMYFDN